MFYYLFFDKLHVLFVNCENIDYKYNDEHYHVPDKHIKRAIGDIFNDNPSIKGLLIVDDNGRFPTISMSMIYYFKEMARWLDDTIVSISWVNDDDDLDDGVPCDKTLVAPVGSLDSWYLTRDLWDNELEKIWPEHNYKLVIRNYLNMCQYKTLVPCISGTYCGDTSDIKIWKKYLSKTK